MVVIVVVVMVGWLQFNSIFSTDRLYYNAVVIIAVVVIIIVVFIFRGIVVLICIASPVSEISPKGTSHVIYSPVSCMWSRFVFHIYGHL